MECGDCERDVHGGVHDQECKYAMHWDEAMAPACDLYGDVISVEAKRTTETGNVNCIVCKQVIRLNATQ